MLVANLPQGGAGHMAPALVPKDVTAAAAAAAAQAAAAAAAAINTNDHK